MTRVDSTIGIIGGADGPTAVFVTGSPIGLVAAVLIVAVVLVGAGAALYLHHKNKQD